MFQAWGFDGIRDIYLLDQVRGKWEFPELLDEARRFWRKHRGIGPGNVPIPGTTIQASRFYIEDKVSGTSLIQTLRREEVIAREWNVRDYDIPEDKVSRAKEFSFLMYNGNVHIPARNMYPWVADYIAEHSAFSEDMGHKNDDQVDGSTSAGLIWKSLGGGLRAAA